ncbi:hypothetical protein Lal_00030281 [Lupinus albus]|nr:hypothetical protein Lal_00030258 [Lupinus albus]KAF1874248.1 hypothetical protein Lal_00030281 [Lupinus albus]
MLCSTNIYCARLLAFLLFDEVKRGRKVGRHWFVIIKKGEIVKKILLLNLTRLLANEAQRKVFEENFHGRAIFTPKYGNIGNFEFEDFLFPYLLRQQKLFDFWCEANDIYPELVRDEIERRKQQSLGETVKNRDILSAGYLTLEDHDNESNGHVRGSRSPLPYAIFITKILEHFGVPLEGETKVAINFRESMVDIEVVHKMGFVIDPVTRRTYKHRTDRQAAPADEPEPTATPNQPESHAQSSASAAMPTNQMIMDELVSLRGYITTRMDAFDTQSQQIHYELHRLSSRLSNMDVDEDSSEPES